MVKFKKTLSIALAACTIFAGSSSSLAAVEAYIAQVDGVKYEFNRDALIESAVEKLLGNESPMYDKYLKGDLVALKDDKRGIVDIKSVENYIINSIIEGKSFDIDEFTETSEEAEIIEIEDLKVVNPEGEVEDCTGTLLYDGETDIELGFGAEFDIPEVKVEDDEIEVKLAISLDGEEVEDVNTRVAGVYTITYSAINSLGEQVDQLLINVTVAQREMKLEVITSGVVPGMNLIRVTLDVDNPEDYTVVVRGRTLSFDSQTETFVGAVNAGATLEDVEYSLNEGVQDEAL